MVVKNNNYYFTYQHPHGDLDVVVGDEKREKFYPRMKIKKWGNETNFSLGIIDDEPEKGVIENIEDHIAWKREDMEAHFYPREDLYAGDDKRGFEFEIYLKEKPQSNVIQLSIETKGLSFFYQPPLTPEEKLEGVNRPENVEGSYAAYHKTQTGDKRQIGGKHYATGKAFHIYRPVAHDVNGEKVYCDINIDENSKVLSITIPQDFLDSALYPIIVDPTFGYTTVGGTQSSGYGPNQFLIFPATLASSSATISSMAIYASFASGGNFQLGIYNTSANPVYQGKTIQQGSAPSSAQWSIISMNDCNVLTTGNYFLVQNHDTAQIVLYQDAGGSQEYYNYAYGFGSWPNPMINGADYGDLDTYFTSIYATYSLPPVSSPIYSAGVAPQPNIGSSTMMI